MKVRVVELILDGRLERRRDRAVLELVPLNRREEGVRLHLVAPRLEAAQPLGGVDAHEPVDGVARVGRHVLGPRDVALEDLAVELDRVVGRKRRLAREALEGEDADGPPVDAETVPLDEDHLGREVLGRAAERPRAVGEHLGEAKVDELEVAVGVEQQILRLEVAVDDVERVQVRDDRRHLRDVEDDLRLVERRLPPEHRVELAALHQLEQHVQLALVVVRRVQPHHERVVARGEDLLLGDDVRLLLGHDDLVLAHHLERVRLARRLVQAQPDAAIRADAHDAPMLEVGPLRRLSRAAQRLLPLLRLLGDQVLDGPDCRREGVAVAAVDAQRLARRRDRRRGRLRRQQRALAEELALDARGDLLPRAVLVVVHVCLPALDDEEGVLLLALLNQGLAVLVRPLRQLAHEGLELGRRQLRKDRRAFDHDRLEDLLHKVARHHVGERAEILPERHRRQLEQLHLADRHHVGLAHRVVRARLEARLAEDGACLEAEVLRPRRAVVLVTDDLALLDEVEGRRLGAHLDHVLTVLQGHLLHQRRELCALRVGQRREQAARLQEVVRLVHQLLVPRAHHHVPEGLAVEHPQRAVL